MASSPGQTLGLTQAQRLQQKLSPLQMRYSALLEMPQQRLEDEVRDALNENPALEADVREDAPAQPAPDPYGAPEDDPYDDVPLPADDPARHDRMMANARAHDADAAPTLTEWLTAQLLDMPLSEAQKETARFIIGTLDPNGYLTRTPAQMASDMELLTARETETRQVEQVLEMLQQRLDPPGVAASGLREALTLQLRRRPAAGEAHPLALRLLEEDEPFAALAARRLDRLPALLGTDEAHARAAVELVRSLNPRPGAPFGSDPGADGANVIIPDFIVERVEAPAPHSHTHSPGNPAPARERWEITMPNNIPALVLSESFATEAPPSSPAALAMSPWREEARTLIKALQMRRATMMAVMKAIVEVQGSFLLSGDPATLRPLLLKDVAAATGLDVSTVSRATSGKYAETPAGVFPLRSFFNEAAGGGGGATDGATDATQHTVMQHIRSYIEAEGADPLSDEAIAARLAADGLPTARRTVAKYRALMQIPPARSRR